jgi:hypothetical protein
LWYNKDKEIQMMSAIKNPTKEQIEKYGIVIVGVQVDDDKAILAVEGPGTGNFLKFIESISGRVEKANSTEGRNLANMFN